MTISRSLVVFKGSFSARDRAKARTQKVGERIKK